MRTDMTPGSRVNPYPGFTGYEAGMTHGMRESREGPMTYAETAKQIRVPESTVKAFWEDFQQRRAENTYTDKRAQLWAEGHMVHVMLCVPPYDVLTEEQVRLLIDTATKDKEQRIKGWMTIANECGLGDVDSKTIHAAFKEQGYSRPSLTKYQAKKDAD